MPEEVVHYHTFRGDFHDEGSVIINTLTDEAQSQTLLKKDNLIYSIIIKSHEKSYLTFKGLHCSVLSELKPLSQLHILKLGWDNPVLIYLRAS